ncbi:ribosomal protein S27AE [Sporomusaceae bacterium BoRhaA]|uniref:hypothetical protein n=1 Tax=Pelorhabdus rhamnosifermentans TaxID=2772457 RepID=UPI001C061717|nr:hypothetical protein [Pelorhabdus rhamnosifermentans]MBU2700603.1 ribosomal protein S27AE [Pelorhabdus rhamnosifermentans]
MNNQLGSKECPKCRNITMIKLPLDSSLADRWKCSNPECGYEEREELSDKLAKRNR